MKENSSPEEKLLRLIRGQKKHAVAADKLPIGQEQEPGRKIHKFQMSLPYNYISILGINKIFVVIFIISCGFLVYTFVYPLFESKDFALPKPIQEKPGEEKNVPAQEAKPYEYYLEGVKNRQIFSGSSGTDSGKAPAAVSSDLIKDMSLIGIVSGDNPQAVIEDKKSQKTYYVTKGQFIGEFKVEDIEDGKIILNYNGQKFELYL